MNMIHFRTHRRVNPSNLGHGQNEQIRVSITPMVRPTVPFIVCHADIIRLIEPDGSRTFLAIT